MVKLERVLFLGNSITWHAPKEEIGWSGSWGMAASSENKDYVHLLMEKVHTVIADAPFMVQNISEYERSFWDYDLQLLTCARAFQPTALIMSIGENVDDELTEVRNFSSSYARLIQSFKVAQTETIICTSCFRDKPKINRFIKEVAACNRYHFVDITHLSRDMRNIAYEMFWHKGVGSHPSDWGMAAIAELIWDEIASLLEGGRNDYHP